MTLKRWLPLIGVVAFGLAVFLVWRALRRYSLDEIAASIAGISAGHLLLAGCFAAGSYLTLTGFDYLAVRYAGGRLPYPRIALASFTALSLGHTLGFAALSSGAIRFRFYTKWGLEPQDVGRIILFCGMTVGVGLAGLGGVAFLTYPALAEELTGFGRTAVIALGLLCLAAIGLWLALAAFVRRPLRWRQYSLAMPSLGLAARQVILGAVNFALVAGTLHRLLPESAEIGYVTVVAAYVIGVVASLISHVPGGLGVLEAVVLSLIPGPEVIGALLAFRVVYFLIPFGLGGLLLLTAEVAGRLRSA